MLWQLLLPHSHDYHYHRCCYCCQLGLDYPCDGCCGRCCLPLAVSPALCYGVYCRDRACLLCDWRTWMWCLCHYALTWVFVARCASPLEWSHRQNLQQSDCQHCHCAQLHLLGPVRHELLQTMPLATLPTGKTGYHYYCFSVLSTVRCSHTDESFAATT